MSWIETLINGKSYILENIRGGARRNEMRYTADHGFAVFSIAFRKDAEKVLDVLRKRFANTG